MFDHAYFDVYPFDAIPQATDCYLMDVKYVAAYEQSMLHRPARGAVTDCHFLQPSRERREWRRTF
jgi:hypothetical protein